MTTFRDILQVSTFLVLVFMWFSMENQLLIWLEDAETQRKEILQVATECGFLKKEAYK